jgi:hypothetical protein
MTSIIKVDQIQTLAGGVPTAADLGLNVSGTALQIVSVSFTSATHYTTSSTTFIPTPILASITPKKSNSQILVSANFGMTYAPTNDAVSLAIYRGATVLGGGLYKTYAGSNSGGLYASTTVEWNDLPETTSEVTYNIYFRSVGGGVVYAPHGSSHSTITLIEIAG